MNERLQCEFFLIRYVPDAVKNEFVNIGVVLREAARPGTAAVRFTRDWSRVRCVDPEADTEMLEALEGEMQARLSEGPDAMMRVLEDSFSNLLQVTEAKACLAESLPAEMEQLSRLYVEARRERERRRASGRAAIAAAMRRQFEAADVWGLMRKRIAAAQYTQAGDPLRIDCGYRPNGVVRMFQAVSLDGDLEAAKVLAFSAAALTEGVLRVERATLELTAVVEPLRDATQAKRGLSPQRARIARREPREEWDLQPSGGAELDRVEQYRFGVETMERSAIRVLTVGDLPRVAARAREELRV